MQLNPELNRLIGGRGSGKSAFLEYIAYGLRRSCTDLSNKNVSGSDRLRDLVRDTFIQRQGELRLIFLEDGA